jgi:glucose-1-phosphate thymidylyltransferase
MKGVVLAGGSGTRLRPITYTGPKQLVPVGNKPVIDYAIEDLREAGIDEVAVVLGEVGSEEIQAHLGDGAAFDVDITYIAQGRPLGLAHAVGCARDFVGDEPFVVYLGDDLMRDGIADLVDEFDPDEHAAGIGLQAVEEPSRYGIVDAGEDGEITQLLEKPEDPPSNLAVIGIYVFTNHVFEQIEPLEPSWRQEFEITEAIQGLVEAGHAVQSHVVDGWWKDTGKPEDVLHANRLVLDDLEPRIEGTVENDELVMGRVELAEGSVIEADAVVRGPVSIDTGTTVGGDAYVGPYTSIGRNCTINSAHLEASVVMDDTTITCNRTVVDSLIGRGTTLVSKDGTRPDGERLIVGEDTSLIL